MQFVRIGKYLAISRITGPTHNLLQTQIATGEQQPPFCECLPPVGNCKHAPLSEAALISAILEGVALANERFGTSYCVTHIRYIENDTGPESVYGFLALELISHLERGGKFQESQPSTGS